MSSQEHAAPMRLERTREALRPYGTTCPFCNDWNHAHACPYPAALAELEQAEAVIAAAAEYRDAMGVMWVRDRDRVARDRLDAALAAFGSGEGDGA